MPRKPTRRPGPIGPGRPRPPAGKKPKPGRRPPRGPKPLKPDFKPHGGGHKPDLSGRPNFVLKKLPGGKGILRPGDRKDFKVGPQPRLKNPEKAPPKIGRPARRRKFGEKNKVIPARKKR